MYTNTIDDGFAINRFEVLADLQAPVSTLLYVCFPGECRQNALYDLVIKHTFYLVLSNYSRNFSHPAEKNFQPITSYLFLGWVCHIFN